MVVPITSFRFLTLLLILLLSPWWSLAQSLTSTDIYEQRAHFLDKVIKEKNKYVSNINESMTIDLPVGLKKRIGNIEYTIAIDSISFTSAGGFITAYLILDPPGSSRPLVFRGTGIKISAQGGLQGEAELQLIGNYDIQVGNELTLSVFGETTRAKWDCEGFRSVQLDAALELSQKVVLPVDDYGIPEEGNVTAFVQATVYDWSDVILDIQLPDFAIPALPDFSFDPGAVVLDLSDVANSSLVQLPASYHAVYNEDISLWQGISIQGLMLRLPGYMKSSDEPIAIQMKDMIIDQSGISFELSANEVISSSEGSLDSWSFGVNELNVSMLRSKLRSAFFNGEVGLPIMDEDSYLGISGIIDGRGQWMFSLETMDEIKVPAFGQATMMIDPSSSIELLKLTGRKVRLLTNLSGELLLKYSLDDFPDFDMSSIHFEELQIASAPPFIEGGIFDLSGLDRSISRFPLSLNEIGFLPGIENETILNMGLDISLSDLKDGALSASAALQLKILASDSSKWKFGGLQLEEARVDFDNGPIAMKGIIRHFENHRIYGDGFAGEVEASISPGINVTARTIFGKEDGFRYWFVDAESLFPSGIPISAGVSIYGLNGGAYNHMRAALNQSTGLIEYLPDSTRGFGFNAGIDLATSPNRKTFNAEAELEMIFNKHGGLSSTTISGTANFMEPPRELNPSYLSLMRMYGIQPPKRRGQISGDLLLHYNNMTKTFHGNIDVYANVAKGVIQGSGDDFLAGRAVLHFDPKDWYIHIGTPEERVGLEFGIDKLRVDADGYFMAGTQVPESPPPPAIVADILQTDVDYMRDLNTLGNGYGFALGASFSMDTKEKQFLMFFGRFQAGIGFDTMLKNYGNDVFCTGSADELGINGWYANGQAYGYFQGAIGINVNLPFANGKYKILDLSSALLLQAQLPNPTWMAGTVGGKYEILNGLVKGDCRFRIEIGNKCDLSEYSAISGLKVISAMSPSENESEVDVFTSPQVAFNLPVNEEFTIEDVEGITRSYKIQLDKVDVKQGGIPVQGDLLLNDESTLAAYQSKDILRSDSEHTFEVELSFMERSGAVWKPMIRAGKPIRESREIEFTTGNAPDFIPPGNIDYSYPAIDQVNYYPGITTSGYIQLKKGQPDLDWLNSNIRLSNSSDTLDLPLQYESGRIEYRVDRDLEPGKAYQLSIATTNDKSEAIDQNVQSEYVQLNESASVRETSLQGNISLTEESVLLNYSFSTSLFQNFTSKVASLSMQDFFLVPGHVWYLKRLRTDYIGSEPFDGSEVGEGGFVKGEAILDNSEYYNQDVYPLVYANYPLDGDITVDRDIQLLGLPPIRSINISANQQTTNVYWDLTPVMAQDFQDIQKKIVRRYLMSGQVSDRVSNIILGHYPPFMYGQFNTKLHYYLPGEKSPVETSLLRFNLPKEF